MGDVPDTAATNSGRQGAAFDAWTAVPTRAACATDRGRISNRERRFPGESVRHLNGFCLFAAGWN
jgi:hypothetical protein